MRRVVIAALLATFVALTAPAHARSVTNASDSQEQASAEWFHELDGGGFVSGHAFAAKPSRGDQWLEISEVVGTPIICDNDTPEPEDDFAGTHLAFVFGSGPATVAISKQYRWATASAVLDLTFDAFDHCSSFLEATPSNGGGNGGGNGGVVVPGVPVALSLTGTGDLMRSSSSGSFRIPGDVNEHSRFDSRWRNASGVVSWGDEQREAPGGFIGKVSWRSHTNN